MPSILPFLSRPRLIRASAVISLLAAFLATMAPASANTPIEVVPSISIEHGNWTPLPAAEMRRAAVDTALARLSDAGRLRILDSEAPGKAGKQSGARGDLAIAIHLIGPAETVKVTITLDAPESPTLVATAAISVRGLDHRGIYEAFEHVGEQSADRLAAKLDHLVRAAETRPPSKNPAKQDPKLRAAYDAAQSAKRGGRYAEARAGFESVVAALADPEDGLRRLAEDELRYGLPLYEAQQAINRMGRAISPGQQPERTAALSRAENLYRQIEAENQDNFDRVAEAQRAIDGMLVMRRALSNAMRANMMSRATSLRMEIMQFSMMEGTCPNEAFVREILARRPGGLALAAFEAGPRGEARYRIEDPASRVSLDLLCSLDGVEVVDATDAAFGSPAATH